MKKLKLLFVIGLFNVNLNAQDIMINLAEQVGGTSAEAANSVSIDQDGNIYMTGYFNGTADFDPGKRNC